MIEYQSHVIPLEPGPGGRTDALLNAFAEDGWRVVSVTPVPARPRADAVSLTGPVSQAGLLVLLVRET